MTITQPSQPPQIPPLMRLSSQADANYNLYPVVFGITPNATDSSRITLVPSGKWNGYQLIDMTKYKSTVQCSNKDRVPYSRYVFDIYVTSAVYPVGNWIVSLNFDSPYVAITAQITVKGTSCLPSERFDVASQRCVAICSCGLIATDEAPTCIYIGKRKSCVHEYTLM